MILDAVNLSSDAEGGTNAGRNCPSGMVHPQAHNAFWGHLVRLPVMAGVSVRTDPYSHQSPLFLETVSHNRRCLINFTLWTHSLIEIFRACTQTVWQKSDCGTLAKLLKWRMGDYVFLGV